MKKLIDYSIQPRGLVITDIETDSLVWQGKIKDLEIDTVLPISGTDDCIVLLDWRQAESVKTGNLIRCGPQGQIQWEVGELPKNVFGVKRPEREVYTSPKIEKNKIIAYALSGFIETIDINTGKIIDSKFTK